MGWYTQPKWFDLRIHESYTQCQGAWLKLTTKPAKKRFYILIQFANKALTIHLLLSRSRRHARVIHFLISLFDYKQTKNKGIYSCYAVLRNLVITKNLVWGPQTLVPPPPPVWRARPLKKLMMVIAKKRWLSDEIVFYFLISNIFLLLQLRGYESFNTP